MTVLGNIRVCVPSQPWGHQLHCELYLKQIHEWLRTYVSTEIEKVTKKGSKAGWILADSGSRLVVAPQQASPSIFHSMLIHQSPYVIIPIATVAVWGGFDLDMIQCALC